MGRFYDMFGLVFWPEITPNPSTPQQWDPNYGFKEPREKKVVLATPLELESAGIKKEYRNYCSHLFIIVRGCLHANRPWRKVCFDEEENLRACLYNEEYDRYKDYERERRLMRRKVRIERKKREAAEKAKKLQEANAAD